MSPVARVPSGSARAALRTAACLVAVAGLGGWSTGCGRSSLNSSERVRYVRHHATRTYGDCTGGHDRCTRITLRWPTVAAAPTAAARESIGAFVRATLYQPYDGGVPVANEDSVMVGFIEAYRAFATRSRETAAAPWWYQRRIEPLGDTLGITSFAVTEAGFLGGAHPNSRTRLVNLDVESGRMLRRADLARDEAGDALDALGEQAFRRVRKLSPDADLVAAGFWFEGGRFRLNDNVAVTTDGLMFFYNDYEVAPHALGATQFTLSWAEVRGHVRRDGPLGRRPR